jgi:hypothetical protein
VACAFAYMSVNERVSMKIRFATEHDLCRIAEMTRGLARHIGGFEWKVESPLKEGKATWNALDYGTIRETMWKQV